MKIVYCTLNALEFSVNSHSKYSFSKYSHLVILLQNQGAVIRLMQSDVETGTT